MYCIISYSDIFFFLNLTNVQNKIHLAIIHSSAAEKYSYFCQYFTFESTGLYSAPGAPTLGWVSPL